MQKGIILATLLLSAAQAAAQQKEPYAGYDAYVNAALAAFKVPGAAIAIVRNDSVVYAKGYGVRELGKPAAVDERTLFAIGSSSKAFTSAAVAMLVDEGKVRWDDPVARFLPQLQLYDPYATRELSMRDVLSHRSGLSRGDLVWYGTQFDRDEILRRVRFLHPSWSFRSQFGYQNIMYLAAGQVVARASGSTWDDVIKTRIFQPLGMTSSNTSTRSLAGNPDVATPHTEIDDTMRAVAWRNIDNIAPAGSINSNVVDMAQWLRLQLGKGKYNGKQLISSAQIDEMQKPHTIVPLDGVWKLFNPASNFLLYGMGWFLEDFHGKKVVQHGGNIDGMSALVAMIPDDKFGMVVLTNANGSLAPYAIMNRTFDAFLKQPPHDWTADMKKAYQSLDSLGKAAEKKVEAQRVSGTTPLLALDKYAATYVDSMYGEARVAVDNGKLRLTRGPAFDAELEHWHYDTFRAIWRDRGLGKTMVTFHVGNDAKIADLAMDLGGGEPIAFKRKPDMADTVAGVKLASADLSTYIGRFESKAPPLTVTVEQLGDHLTLNVPGQPAYTMVAVTTTRFKLTGENMPAGFFFNYVIEGGKVKSVSLEQPPPQITLAFTPIK